MEHYYYFFYMFHFVVVVVVDLRERVHSILIFIFIVAIFQNRPQLKNIYKRTDQFIF